MALLPPKKTARRAPRKHQIDLALQGGGSHGAFTWGVLDRLLEEEWLEIAGVSGTSAGAMNAVALASGLMKNGRQGARDNLKLFWRRVSEASPFAGLHNSLGATHPWLQAFMAPFQQAAQLMGSQFSPYQFNPLNLNPLREILAETVDFEQVRACHRTQLFIAATEVRTGALRTFRQNELSADAVLASACLPLLFQAVQVGDEAYWDGGYAGNPTLLPLIGETAADDLLLVQINPSRRETLPTTAHDILERTNEVTFNASLLKELRTIALLKQLIEETGRPEKPYREPLFQRIDDLRLHKLDAEAQLAPFGADSKMRTDWGFLSQLHSIGRQAAHAWLLKHGSHIGQRSTYALPSDLNA